MHEFKILLLFIFVLLFIFIGFIAIQDPKHNRNWEDQAKILPTVFVEGDIVHISRVRDFKYSADEVLALDYIIVSK